MPLVELLKGIHSLEDLPALAAALGHEPLWDPVPGGPEATVVVGRAGDFPWYALVGRRAPITGPARWRGEWPPAGGSAAPGASIPAAGG